jgi:hypothetical protein
VKAKISQILFALLLASPACFSQTLSFNEINPLFGAVAVGKSSEPKIISVSNVSSGPIFILQIQATDDFTQGNSCPIWLPEGETCLVHITFTPTATGARTGRLYVDWAGKGDQWISLSGFGLPLPDSRDAASPPTVDQASRTTNDEEKADELNHLKGFTFAALLRNNPPDVANQERIFSLTRDTQQKERIASILLSLGVKDPIYFDYLTAEAKKILAHDHDIPWPEIYGDDEEPKYANPALNEWCEKHRMDFGAMDDVSKYEIPVAWYYLAAASDPRAYDLLIKGLNSPNLMIAGRAAQGLAMLQDPRAINVLIAAGRTAHGLARGLIAQSLLFFPDPKAQAAASEIAPVKLKHMMEVWRGEIKEKGLRVLFPW